MKKLQTFFYVFKNSITSPKYYNDILKTKIGFSIKYFILLSAFASVAFVIPLSIRNIPEIKKGMDIFVEKIKETYPDDLVVEFREGSWEINQEEPYKIRFPTIPEIGLEGTGLENAIVFDKNGTIEDLETYSTMSLLNEINLLYKDRSGNVVARPVKEIPDFSLDKATVASRLDNTYKYLRLVPYLLPPLFFVFEFLFNHLGEGLFNILWAGLIIYLFALVRRNRLSYKSACQIGIHTMTIPIILRIVFKFVQFNLLFVGWFSTLNIVIALIFIMKMRKEGEAIEKIEKKVEKPKDDSKN